MLSNSVSRTNSRRQGVYWLCTFGYEEFYGCMAPLPDGVQYMLGQLERGQETGYLHWQVFVGLKRKGSFRTMQKIFGETGHYELSNSKAAEAYVHKDDTCADPSLRFSLGEKPISRSNPRDWELVWQLAQEGLVLAH